MVQTNVIVSENKFNSNSELVKKYGNYDNYLAAQMHELKRTSAWTFGKKNFMDMRSKRLAKHNAESEELIAKYKALEAQYKAMKKQQSYVEANLYGKYGVQTTGDLSQALQKENSLVDQGKFNLAARNTNEARINYEVALSIALDQTHQIV